MGQTFKSTYTQLMATVNRPLSELSVLTGAKYEINQAIKYLQRDHAYSYTERLTQYVNTAGTLYYNLGSICGGLLRDLMSIQLLNDSGKPAGLPLKIMTYNQLQQLRGNFARTHPYGPNDWFTSQNCDNFFTIEDCFRQDKIAFISGPNVGLYPISTKDETLLVNCHIWLPDLVQDADANFFLDFASDVVMMCALKRMHLYMKSDSRYQITAAEFQEVVSTLKAWDSQVRETPNTNIAGHTSI